MSRTMLALQKYEISPTYQSKFSIFVFTNVKNKYQKLNYLRT